MVAKMMRCLSAVLVAALLWTSTLYSAVAAAYMPADADSDGQVTLVDVALVSRWCAGWSVSINEANADVNYDDVVNLKDVTLLKRALAGGWNVVLGEATLTFEATTNGGTFTAGNGFGTGDSAKKVVYGSVYKTADADNKTWPANPKKYGCAFKGWYTAPVGGTKISETSRVQLRGNVTLYAQFGGYMETPEIGI